MEIGLAPHRYRWHEHWARIPDSPSARLNGRTHGVAALPDGRVAVFAQAVPGVLFYDASGTLVDHWGDRFLGAHGLQVVQEDGQTFLWLVDEVSCEVCKVGLDGELIQRLDHPPADERPDAYKPTWADVDPATGDVWVADGYGGFRLYRWSASGDYLGSYREAGGVPFDCPHGLAFGPDGLLYVADRVNHRVVVLDGEGQLVRSTVSACHSPTSIAFHGDEVYVAELLGGLKVLDADLEVVADLGRHPRVAPASGWEGRDTWTLPSDAPGWPEWAGTEEVSPGVFSSPHGVAVDARGDVYVVEWVTGGRIIKLERLDSPGHLGA